MKLIVGLGNPVKKYQKTRHNAGFVVVDRIINNKQLIATKNKKMVSEIASGEFGNAKVILAKPQTYMNESGRAVRAMMDYYKIEPRNLIVIHDDKDLPLGEIRVQSGRGSAGHNGVQSIIDHLGAKDFTRVRVGIAPNNASEINDTSDFVLGKFSRDEQMELNNVIQKAISEIDDLIKMENVNLKM